MEEILKIFKNDDFIKLKELLNNQKKIDIILPKKIFGVPEFLKNSPPLICLTAYFKSILCLKFLINYGYDLKLSDQINRDITHFAATGGSLEIVEILSNHDLNWSNTDLNGNNSFHYSIIYQNKSISFWL